MEAVLAIVILSIAIPPMAWALREANVKRVNPMLVTQARWLATEKLEDVIADRHSATRGYGYLANANYPAEAAGSIAGFSGFARSVEIIETGADLATAGAGYKRITVRVTWMDAGQTARELVIATVVTDY